MYSIGFALFLHLHIAYMSIFVPLLIVAISADASISDHYPEGAEIFSCDFGQGWDENFDEFPDQWSRHLDRGYPEYVSIRIVEEAGPSGPHCLRIEMDGGAALVRSPPLSASPLFAYVLEAYIKTEDLQHDTAYLSLALLDEENRLLATHRSRQIQSSKGWRRIRIGPIKPAYPSTRRLRIGLHVEPGEEADLGGVVWFGDVWMGRLPRISLWTDNPHQVFTDASRISVHCKASGFTDEDQSVAFRLEDALGLEIKQTRRRLKTRIGAGSYVISAGESPDRSVSLLGEAEWNPPIPGPGFYRVWVTMSGREGRSHRQDLTLAVVRPQRAMTDGEFGWTLPDGDQMLPLFELGQLVGQAGVSWVKYPMWVDPDVDDEQMQRLIRFADRMSAYGIQLVGMLDVPPEGLRQEHGAPTAAEIFSADPSLWNPSLTAVLMRMAPYVRWWQLGSDRDSDFADFPDLQAKIVQIKTEMDQIGYDVNLGFGWRWMRQFPGADLPQPAWRFLALTADPPLTHRELPRYLELAPTGGVYRWISLQPLSRTHYSRDDRCMDLVQRMMAAKIHKAEAVFVPDPFDSDHGLMNENGSPGDLFLPWRTTALMLGGTQYIQSIQMPQGSRNEIFAAGEDAVMVLWNDTATEEVLYLGDEIQHIDLWGRNLAPSRIGHRHVLKVGPLPTFVTGVDILVTRWRQNFALDSTSIRSVFAEKHENGVTFQNVFDRGVSGTALLIPPDLWRMTPGRIPFQLLKGQEFKKPFTITLPKDGTSGSHPVEIDLRMQGERNHHFSVYRRIDIGTGDIYIEFRTRLNEQGELEVQQRFVNETAVPVTFRCELFAFRGKAQKIDVVKLGSGIDVQTFTLPNGEALIGQLMIVRAREVGGTESRNLGYKFRAQR